jgi:hypothetical protein
MRRATDVSLNLRGCCVMNGKKPRNRSQQKLVLDKQFHARTFDEADGRRSTVKAMRKLIGQLKIDANADSVQKELLCKRAAFIVLRLESMETEFAEGNEIDWSSFTQLTGCLLRLLKSLGIEKSVNHQATDLQKHLEKYQPMGEGQRKAKPR